MGQVLKYLLDTDLLSQVTKITSDQVVEQWLATMNLEDSFISVITLQEIQTGIDLLPAGRRREALIRWFTRDVVVGFAERTLPVSPAIALECGVLVAAAKLGGHTADSGDALIAATAKVHGLQMVTLNRKHFVRLGVMPIDF